MMDPEGSKRGQVIYLREFKKVRQEVYASYITLHRRGCLFQYTLSFVSLNQLNLLNRIEIPYANGRLLVCIMV